MWLLDCPHFLHRAEPLHPPVFPHTLVHAGQMQLHNLQRTPPQVLQPLPGTPHTSLTAGLALLESFPGPLGSSTKADKVRWWQLGEGVLAAARKGAR